MNMKSLIILLLLLTACSRTPGVVIDKDIYSIVGWGKEPLPKGMCRFAISGTTIDKVYVTIDSCHLYHLMDTIKNKPASI